MTTCGAYRVVHRKFPIDISYYQNFNTEATETCKTAIERKFCQLLENNFKNCENSSYEVKFAFFWQMAELASAHLKSNFEF